MWQWILLAVLIFFIIALFWLQRRTDQGVIESIQPIPSKNKPVVMLIIDSLMDQPLQQAIDTGKAPALSFLMRQGIYEPKLISSFPTMSVCIETTLLTGTLPNDHQIYGLVYYDESEKRIINIGTGAREVVRFGLKRVLTESLCNLNQRLINPQTLTIHEELENQSASINAMVYRGRHPHTLRIPRLSHWFRLLPKEISTIGPPILSFGVLSSIDAKSEKRWPWFRYGMNDRFTQNELVSLIEHQLLPPFTIAYFPGNDDHVHQKGASQIQGITQVDQELQAILDAFPSWEDAVKECTWIILGDSGQASMISDTQQGYLDLRQCLHPYQIMPIQKKHPTEEDQLVLCVNERMAYIYVLDADLSLQEIAHQCQQEERLDIIAWRNQGWIEVISGTRPGRFRFSAEGDIRDAYQQTWTLQGDGQILDLTIENQQVHDGMYPDVLTRLAGVMNTSPRVVVITVAPGYEMIGESSPTHKGGAHGSLHYTDTYVPMIVCGTDRLPATPRIIDFKNWILDLTKE